MDNIRHLEKQEREGIEKATQKRAKRTTRSQTELGLREWGFFSYSQQGLALPTYMGTHGHTISS